MLDHHIPPAAREKATGKVTEKASQVASATGLALIPAIFRAGYFTALLLFIALLPAAGSQSATNRTVLVMGDSISAAYGMSLEQGWVALLAGRLAASHPDWLVINASISGETSAGAAARLPALLEEHAPAVVIIELGGNDGLRGYPVKRLQANLQTMVEQSQAVGAEVLILAMEIPPNYGSRYTEAFRSSFASVAEATGTTLSPFMLDGVATDRSLMQSDGIHPTAAAQPLLLANVWSHLEPLLEKPGGQDRNPRIHAPSHPSNAPAR